MSVPGINTSLRVNYGTVQWYHRALSPHYIVIIPPIKVMIVKIIAIIIVYVNESEMWCSSCLVPRMEKAVRPSS